MAFYGIGPGPRGTEQLGCCTQMALFVREDFLELTSPKVYGQEVAEAAAQYNNQSDLRESDKMETNLCLNENATSKKCIVEHTRADERICQTEDAEMNNIAIELSATHIDKMNYRLIQSCTYPRVWDDRSREEKILDEGVFHLNRYMNLDDYDYDSENNVIKVPVTEVFNLVYRQTTDINEFR